MLYNKLKETTAYGEHLVDELEHLLAPVGEHGVQRALVEHAAEAVLPVGHGGHVHDLEAEPLALAGVLRLHLPYDDLGEVDAAHAAVADVVEVGREGGVAAADDEDVVLGLDVLVEEAAELCVLAVPLEGLLAALLEEAVPVRVRAELLVVLRQKVHPCEGLRTEDRLLTFGISAINLTDA